MRNSKPSRRQLAPAVRIKRNLAQLARTHVRQAFNAGFAHSAAVKPKMKTATFCAWFVTAFQKELDRVPTRDK
jgi:hypothetical protein